MPALSWTARRRLGGEKASKACITGAPNDRRFFFFSSSLLLLGVRKLNSLPSLPFFASGDIFDGDGDRLRLSTLNGDIDWLWQVKSAVSRVFLRQHLPPSQFSFEIRFRFFRSHGQLQERDSSRNESGTETVGPLTENEHRKRDGAAGKDFHCGLTRKEELAYPGVAPEKYAYSCTAKKQRVALTVYGGFRCMCAQATLTATACDRTFPSQNSIQLSSSGSCGYTRK